MKQHLLLVPAALLALTACEKETIVANGPADPQAEELAKAKPVELPPAIVASRTYRCKDNSLTYVEFLSNNTAVYRSKKDGPPTSLAAATPGGPYTADGYSVSANAEQVQITAPGKGSLSCKA
jgi:hypothetical protein